MQKLGIEPVQLLLQLFNFVLMVLVLTKLLYNPIRRKLEERREKIAEGLEYARKIKEEEEEIGRKKEEVMNQARSDAKIVIEESKISGKKLEEEIVKNAQQEASVIIEKARKDIELERQELLKSVKREAVDIATAMAEKVIGEILTDTDHQRIINKKLKIIAGLKP